MDQGEAGGSAGAQVIMIVRHGEKPPEGGGAPHGITRDGDHDRHALITRGWARAGALVGLFAPVDASPRPPLVRPERVYAAHPTDGKHRRESETVSLVADQLGVRLEMPCAVGQEDELAARVREHDGATLVCWDHLRIPHLVQSFGVIEPPVPAAWPPERFDMVYLLTRTSPGSYALTQVPQLLLPGDSPEPIG